MIKSFEIKNYRSCIATKVDLHPNLTVLIGTNGAGKSNVLNAIKIFSTIDRVRPAFIDLYEDDIENRSNINANLVINEKDDLAISLRSVLIHSQDERNNDDVQSIEMKYRLNGSTNKSYKFIDQDLIEFSSFLKRTRLSRELPKQFKTKENQILLSALKELQDVSYYGASLFTDPSKCPTAIDLERFKISSRRRNSAKTPEQFIYDLYKEYRKDSEIFSQFKYAVCDTGVSLIDNIEFVEQNLPSSSHKIGAGGKVITTEKVNRIIIPYFTIDGIALSPNQLSDGTFKTLALVFYILSDKNKLLLIEEPEVSVHHGLLISIMQLILQESKSKQIILSTHSDMVLDQVEPENVVLVQKTKNGTKANALSKSLSRSNYKILKDYLIEEGNLGEYWREGGLDE